MPEPTPLKVAVEGLCPRCGSRTLFATFLRFADKCSVCGLDFSSYNVGDGPAAFLTLGIGTLITIFAVVVELAYSPPFWVHALLWLPLTIILVIGSLRIAKAALIALEHKNSAHEGRIMQDEP